MIGLPFQLLQQDKEDTQREDFSTIKGSSHRLALVTFRYIWYRVDRTMCFKVKTGGLIRLISISAIRETALTKQNKTK